MTDWEVIDRVLDTLDLGLKRIKMEIVNLDDINVCDEEGSSLLMWIVLSWHIDAFKVVLSMPRIDVNKSNKYGDTALSMAISDGCLIMVDRLLKCGAVITPELLKLSHDLLTNGPFPGRLQGAQGSLMFEVDYEGVYDRLKNN